MWTAAADPHVLRARVFPQPDYVGNGIELSRFARFIWQHGGCHHVRLDLPSGVVRFDLLGGAIVPGIIRVEPAVDLGRPIDPQFASIRRLDVLMRGDPPPPREQCFVRLVEALRAADALAAGASLRDFALGALGDDWPGDGEHLKSRARRRVVLAGDLLRAGPRGVLLRKI